MIETPTMVDWGLAESTAHRLLPNGPAATPEDARAVVEGLRTAAAQSGQHILDITRMSPIEPLAPVVVVDRANWVTSNLDGFRTAIDPLMAMVREQRLGNANGVDDPTSVPEDAESATPKSARGSAMVSAVGSRATGFQVGTLLAFVGSKVLGQHEVFVPEGRERRLLLVAPNVLVAERNLGVDPVAFRLWICLHEETHRVQLATVPWLIDRIWADLKAFVTAAELDSTALRERLGALVSSTGAAVRGESGRSLLDAVQTPEQRVILDRLVALMTLLEGHADWAMDQVGDDVISGLDDVRARFEKRRDGVGALDQVLRRLFGLDQKLAQYRDGSAFVRAVVAQIGVDGFNAVWSSEDTLPTRTEIHDPSLWISRVHGAAA